VAKVKTLKEAAEALGLTPQGVAYYAAMAGCPTVQVGKVRKYPWPDFPKWYRERLQDEGKPKSIDEAERRKATADAELAELKLATARGQTALIAEMEKAVNADYAKVRAKLVAFPGRVAPLLLGLKTAAEAKIKLTTYVNEVIEEIRERD